MDDYRDWLNERQRTVSRDAAPRAAGNGNSAIERREQKRQDAERRQQLAIQRKPLDQRVRALEQRMEKLHAEQRTLETALADPFSYDDANKNRLKEWLLRKGEVDRELEALETEWLEIQEAIEALTADGGAD